jgi:hypothetical protein
MQMIARRVLTKINSLHRFHNSKSLRLLHLDYRKQKLRFLKGFCPLPCPLLCLTPVIVGSCFRLSLLDEMGDQPIDEKKFLEIIEVSTEFFF